MSKKIIYNKLYTALFPMTAVSLWVRKKMWLTNELFDFEF